VENLESRSLKLFQNNLKIDLNYDFNNEKLLFQSFLHRSFIHETFNQMGSNERLEFLGDSVLGLYVSSKLFSLFPMMEEGKLSKLKSSIVNEVTLAKIARVLGLGSYILLGKGEIMANGYEKNSILADCFRALIGAIYIDGGHKSAYQSLDFIFNLFEEKQTALFTCENLDFFDARTRLQEISVKKYKVLPIYDSLEIDDGYQVSLSILNKKLGTIVGASKKKAKEALANKVLKEELYLNLGDNNAH
jgi:ribonuclease-3